MVRWCVAFGAVIIPAISILAGCGAEPCVPAPEVEYRLPYPAGVQSLVGQGNFGPVSHQDEYALDFIMPMQAPIVAARGGTVVQVDDTQTETCWLTKDCKANRVVIEHADGSRARYIHLAHQGARVKLGDKVRQGDLIGLCGQTGIAFLPHLHFTVRDRQNRSIEVRFADVCENDGVPQPFHEYTSQNTGQADSGS
jgi:murein DD-endopeptidase MepM/ murein hydrolase activator NlpD